MSAAVASLTPLPPFVLFVFSSLVLWLSFLARTAMTTCVNFMAAARPHVRPHSRAAMSSDVYLSGRSSSLPPFLAGLLGGGGSGMKKAVPHLGDNCRRNLGHVDLTD